MLSPHFLDLGDLKPCGFEVELTGVDVDPVDQFLVLCPTPPVRRDERQEGVEADGWRCWIIDCCRDRCWAMDGEVRSRSRSSNRRIVGCVDNKEREGENNKRGVETRRDLHLSLSRHALKSEHY